jgi:hypothetical protein
MSSEVKMVVTTKNDGSDGINLVLADATVLAHDVRLVRSHIPSQETLRGREFPIIPVQAKLSRSGEVCDQKRSNSR